MAELPCDADGHCMVCKVIPLDSEVILCNSCSSPWHISCLHTPMPSVPVEDWFCPDCEPSPSSVQEAVQTAASFNGDHADSVARIRAIRADPNLSEQEKARRCQDVMGKNGNVLEKNGTQETKMHKMLQIFDENLNCIFCMQLADRPVTTPCGHNFCLKCFQRWVAQGKKECGKCRTFIPAKMACQPRINSALVVAIRMAKSSSLPPISGPPKPYQYIQNQDRPDKCFTTERAKKPGKSNAASGKIFVTVPPDHFGPITAEDDPMRGQGVLVGETWEDRMECRQWGVHIPHVAGIAGQSDYGAQSVALSGGYEDDEDHGEWFLYTGSGGRDLSGNRRTNGKHSFDQKFDKSNLALKVSCKRGYPVRVVRSHKEKRSAYAPETGVRYDGIYRIEKCWRKNGVQGFKVCRYLFMRCDNEAAPWTSDQIGDRPRPLPEIRELKDAVDLTERRGQPAWDWKEEEAKWGWVSMPPTSRKTDDGSCFPRGGMRKSLTIRQRMLKEFGCGSCKKVLKSPVSTPCGHNFCKSCLLATFSGEKEARKRTCEGGRVLRAQKVVKRCPVCQGDIDYFLTNPQVNRQMEDVIQSLKEQSSDTENNGISKEVEISSSQRKEEVDLMKGSQIISGNSNESASSAHPEKICDGASENHVTGTKVRTGAIKKEFLKVDQEDDVGEREFLLAALQTQEKQKRKQQQNVERQEANGCKTDSTELNDGPENPRRRRDLQVDVDDSKRQKKRKKDGTNNE